MSREYTLAIALVLGGLLKAIGIEIENSVLEGFVLGAIALGIAIFRYGKGDITPLGARK